MITYAIGIAIHFEQKNRVLIKKRYYTVTMAIIEIVRVELNRVINEELIDTQFNYFGEGLVLALFEVKITVRIHIISIGIMEGRTSEKRIQAYSAVWWLYDRKSVKKVHY